MRNTITILPNPNTDFKIQALDVNETTLVMPARKPETSKKNAEFFEALGYIASHAKMIKARMQDTLYPLFIKVFDTDKDAIEIMSSKYVSPRGWHTSWCLSMRILFDAKDAKHRPMLVKEAIRGESDSCKDTLFSTDFVTMLIQDYGFEFKRSQNIEKIQHTIPKRYLKAFNRGLEMGLAK